MQRNIQTPHEFLAYLQQYHSVALFTEPQDKEMSAVVDARAHELETELGPPGSNLEQLVRSMEREILDSLIGAERELVLPAVAMGVLDNPRVNAGIMRGFEGFCAAVINSGFMMALNKVLKLAQACRNPSCVIYCNRGDAASFRGEDYIEMLDEFVSHYRSRHVPLGPRLILRDAESALVSHGLYSAELFALCHEIGHFLNGDLDQDGSLAEFAAGVDVLTENVDHELEYAADRKGYEILLRIHPPTDRAQSVASLLGVVTAFDFIHVVGGGVESDGHPAPLERGILLAETFTGPEVARILRASYDDPKVLLDL